MAVLSRSLYSVAC